MKARLWPTHHLIRSLAIGFILFLGCIGAAPAEDTRRFERVVEYWLADDDENSLPQLAELARDGHSTARMLLARIETEDKGPSRFRRALGLRQARSMFRKVRETGVGHYSWLAVEAAAGNEIAVALLKAKKPSPRPDLVAELHRLGEAQATDHPTRIIALYGDEGMKRALMRSPHLLPELLPYLQYLTETPEPRGDGLAALRHIAGGEAAHISADDEDALAMAGLLALGLGFGDISAGNPWRQVVETWIQTAPSTRPIANLCKAHCASEQAACGFAMLALTGGYFEVVRLDTPLETIIPQPVFLDSIRAQNMALRRAALVRAETNLEWLSDSPDLPKISQCAAKLVRSARSERQ